jgi:hypothetical protein
VGVTKSVWLQSAISVSLESQSLSRRDYDDALLDLALFGHELTSLDGSTLLRATTRWGASSLTVFQRIVKALTSPTLEVNSLNTVCYRFVRELWTQARSRQTKESLTAILLAACCQSHKGTSAVLCRALERTIKEFRADIGEANARQLGHALQFIRQWLTVHPAA